MPPGCASKSPVVIDYSQFTTQLHMQQLTNSALQTLGLLLISTILEICKCDWAYADYTLFGHKLHPILSCGIKCKEGNFGMLTWPVFTGPVTNVHTKTIKQVFGGISILHAC